jgi:hypothetical protein
MSKNKKKSEEELDAKKCEMLDKVSSFIVRRKLQLPATLFIEGTTPVHFISAQVLIFIEPFLTFIFKEEDIIRFREIVEDKKYVNYLLDKLNED